MGPMPEPLREVLQRLHLLEGPPRPRPAAAAPPAPAPPKPAPAPPAPATPSQAPAPRAAAPPAPPSPPAPEPPEEDADVEILFDDEAPAPRAAAVPGRGVRAPEPDVLEEIAFYLEQGMASDALQRLAALRTLGYGGAELDALEKRAGVASAAEEGARLDEDALRSLTESLDAEVAEEPAGVLDAEPAEEQSLAEVFAAFKREVQVQVGDQDPRTYYDLGIAYKEMGLLDDALEAFQTASSSPVLLREASSMIGMVHVERGEFLDAATAYRRALQVAGQDDQGLRYALADVLAQAGQVAEARELFQGIASANPEYRDVRARLAEIEDLLRR
jgi:tetratricopeptide (TPR) repeat protein